MQGTRGQPAPHRGDADLMGGGAGRMLGRGGALCTVRKCLSLVLKVPSLQFDVETNEIRHRHWVKASLALAWGHRRGVSSQLASGSAYAPRTPAVPAACPPPLASLSPSTASQGPAGGSALARKQLAFGERHCDSQAGGGGAQGRTEAWRAEEVSGRPLLEGELGPRLMESP